MNARLFLYSGSRYPFKKKRFPHVILHTDRQRFHVFSTHWMTLVQVRIEFGDQHVAPVQIF